MLTCHCFFLWLLVWKDMRKTACWELRAATNHSEMHARWSELFAFAVPTCTSSASNLETSSISLCIIAVHMYCLTSIHSFSTALCMHPEVDTNLYTTLGTKTFISPLLHHFRSDLVPGEQSWADSPYHRACFMSSSLGTSTVTLLSSLGTSMWSTRVHHSHGIANCKGSISRCDILNTVQAKNPTLIR